MDTVEATDDLIKATFLPSMDRPLAFENENRMRAVILVVQYFLAMAIAHPLRRFLLLGSILAIAPAASWAVEGANLSLGYDYVPPVGLSHPDAGTFQDGVKFNAGIFSAGLSAPLVKAGGFLFSQGAGYRNEQFTFEHWDDSQQTSPPSDFQVISYRVVALRPLENRESLALFLMPELSSDLHNVSWDQVQFLGGATFNWAWTRSNLGVGLASTTSFGRLRVIPFVHWDWTDAAHWWVMVNVPAADVWYGITPTVQAGLGLSFTGGQFRIGADGPYSDDRVRYSSGRFGPAVRFKIAKDLVLKIQGGVAFRQRYGIYDGNNNEIETLDPSTDGYVQAGITYRIGEASKYPFPGSSNASF